MEYTIKDTKFSLNEDYVNNMLVIENNGIGDWCSLVFYTKNITDFNLKITLNKVEALEFNKTLLKRLTIDLNLLPKLKSLVIVNNKKLRKLNLNFTDTLLFLYIEKNLIKKLKLNKSINTRISVKNNKTINRKKFYGISK